MFNKEITSSNGGYFSIVMLVFGKVIKHKFRQTSSRWWFQPLWKILPSVFKMGIFPILGENKTCLKPPPSHTTSTHPALMVGPFQRSGYHWQIFVLQNLADFRVMLVLFLSFLMLHGPFCSRGFGTWVLRVPKHLFTGELWSTRALKTHRGETPSKLLAHCVCCRFCWWFQGEFNHHENPWLWSINHGEKHPAVWFIRF